MTRLVLGLALCLLLGTLWLIHAFRHFAIWRWLAPLGAMVMTALLYTQWGGWSVLWQHHQDDLKHQRAVALLKTYKGPADILQKMEAAVEKQPDKAQGWYLLGRLYLAQQQFNKAELAFARACELLPHKLEYQLQWVQASFIANSQQLTTQTRTTLHQLLKQQPEQPDALNFLALDAFNHADYTHASQYWMQMLPKMADGTEDKKQVLAAVAEAQKRMASKQ